MRIPRMVAALAIFSLPTAASGHGFNVEGLWVGTGMNMGFESDGVGLLVGGEISVAELDDTHWYGGFLDVLYAAEGETTRVTFGLEGGYFLFGADVGMTIDADTRDVGGRVRGLLSLAMQTVYVGGLLFPDETPVLEAGVIVKLPIPLQ